jgi:hypothetical protein
VKNQRCASPTELDSAISAQMAVGNMALRFSTASECSMITSLAPSDRDRQRAAFAPIGAPSRK